MFFLASANHIYIYAYIAWTNVARARVVQGRQKRTYTQLMEWIWDGDRSVHADNVNTAGEHSCACAHPTSAIQRLNAGSQAPRHWG